MAEARRGIDCMLLVPVLLEAGGDAQRCLSGVACVRLTWALWHTDAGREE